ncbi:MAG: peptidylprolyl isomerase [Mycobacteriales bacterium]
MPGKDRQRQLAREKLQRQMAKRAAEARRRRRLQAIAGSAVGVLAIVALTGFAVAKLGGNDKKTAKPAAAPSATKAPEGCSYPDDVRSPSARKVAKPSVKDVAKTGTVQVVMTTNQGSLTLTLDRAKAPCTVNNFVSLAKQKYFDKTPCHRVTADGLMQCGDPTGTSAGGPGYTFADEGLPPAGQSTKVTYPTATVAMANNGPNTNGSQFFIVYKDIKFFPDYVVFGTVSKGLNTVVKIAANGSSPPGDGKPTKPVTIESMKIV